MQKKISTICKSAAVAALICLPSLMTAQQVIFSENFGNPTSEKDEAITDHVWNNDANMYTWSDASAINVRFNKPSTGYNGASGEGNLYFNETPVSFTISGINTLNYENVTLSFGIFGKEAGAAKQMKVSCNNNNSGETPLIDTKDAGLSAEKGGWELISGQTLPESSNLSLTFASYAGDVAAEIRIDDVTVTGTPKSGNNISTTATLPVIYTNGQELCINGTKGKTTIHAISGSKVTEIPASESIRLSLPKGIYIVKIGNAISKIAIK